MKILLIVPAGRDYRITSASQSVPDRSMLRFSVLPVLAVAAATPPTHEVRICDENVEPIDFDADVDVVGVSIMTATANRGKEIARKFRQRGKVVVAGGFHATLYTDDIMRDFHAVVAGDAEGAWADLLADAEKGCLKKLYHNEQPLDLSALSVPRRDLLGTTAKYYATANAVQIGRGCIHGCRYCSITAFHKQTYRHRPVEHVIEEIKQLSRDIIFVDDNIISEPDYAKRLFAAMAPLKKRWVSQSSLDIADDPELLELARRAGCHGLFVGIETINEKNLASVNKAFNSIQRYRKRIAALQRHGIGIIAGIIVGMDNDEVEVFENTLRFLDETGIQAIQVNIMTPLPGTPLYEYYRNAGRIIDYNFDHYDFRHCVFEPRRMSPAQLQNGADWLYRKFYRLDRILMRTLRTLVKAGPVTAYLAWRLNMTYRYDNKRESIIGRNPANSAASWRDRFRGLLHLFRKKTRPVVQGNTVRPPVAVFPVSADRPVLQPRDRGSVQ
jgi:radical SAM superfamily enzyme YgiQ (UPF0313 family)